MENNLSNFSMDFFKLDGKVAVITGGNTGIGQAYAVALAKAGADLFIVCHSEKYEQTRKLIEAEGKRAEFIQVDLEKRESIDKIMERCLKVYGKIDILVNNAGVIKRNPLLKYQDSDWQTVINVNLNSVYYMCHEVSKIMIKQGNGKIINVASMLSFQGGKFVPSYTAAKHGVAGITKAFANELANKNIQVNAIAPGYVTTANTAPIIENKERKDEISARIPAGRWASPSDLMGAVIFLASRASDYVNGHILAVDGGWLAS